MIRILAFVAIPALILGALFYSVIRAVAKRRGWKRTTLARIRKTLLVTAVIGLIVMARLVAMIPGNSASGMVKDSPDGRYRAECWAGTTEGFFGGTGSYLRFVIIETASGREVVLLEEPMPDPPVEAEIRDGGGVRWAPDSTSVTFRFREGVEREIEIPE